MKKQITIRLEEKEKNYIAEAMCTLMDIESMLEENEKTHIVKDYRNMLTKEELTSARKVLEFLFDMGDKTDFYIAHEDEDNYLF